MISTLVSFSKREIYEEIPGMQNSGYRIAPCKSFAEPTLLGIDDSYYYKPDIEGNQDRVFVPSSAIAESIVHMHVTSQLASRADQHPAFFAIVNNELTVGDLFKNHKKQVDDYLTRQRKWYEALVRLADDDWQQLRRHNMISDVQRTAARELGLTREWLNAVDYTEIKEDCPFCGSQLLNANTPICPNCGKVHNPAKLAEIEARFAPAKDPLTGKVK